MNILEHRENKVDFRLQQMDLIYEQAAGQIDVAHRHDYFTLLLVEEAEGVHIVDYNKYTFGKLEVHFVSPGQVHLPPNPTFLYILRTFLYRPLNK